MITETQLVIEIDGQIVSGWERFTVDVTLDQCTRNFSADVFDESGEVAALAISGAPVTVYAIQSIPQLFRRYPLITGYLDSVSRRLDGEEETLTISGRGLTCDLVDCSAVWKSSTWTGAKFSQIVKDLIAPYGVKLDKSQLQDDPKIEAFTLQNGETVFSAVERLARFVGVLPVENEIGSLVLTYAAPITARASEDLTVGRNVQEVEFKDDQRQRFSEYVGKSQTRGGGKRWTAQTLQVKATATDAGIGRHRPMVIIAETKQDKATLAKRIAWEAQVRAGRGSEVSVALPDFFQRSATGVIIRPWVVNERVELVVEKWDLKKEFLISGVTYSMSKEERICTLQLRHPDTYKPDPASTVDLS